MHWILRVQRCDSDGSKYPILAKYLQISKLSTKPHSAQRAMDQEPLDI